ncbi:MAG: hypothetical protein QOG03_1908 [Actinomycetota bacterium]|jgi:uncharacterized membrane protein YeaQ/YmgE (transglycosylase-associated protein family)|nr:hypothetical protein [Actinomycetota bacterium]
MGIGSWIVVGFLAAVIAGMITGQRQEGCITKIVVGVIGALIGGALAKTAGYGTLTGINFRSVVIAALGATAFLLVLGALEGRRRHL